jgi:hypothetical protein
VKRFACAILLACGQVIDAPDASDAAPDTTLDACAFCFDAGLPEATPLVVCPQVPPVLGASCDVPGFEDCEYGAKSYFCNAHFICQNGAWVKNFAVQTQICAPDDDCDAATSMGLCSALGQVCPGADGGLCVCTECGAGPPPDNPMKQWHCAAKSACDVVRPNGGTACNGDASCGYPGGCCYGVYEACVDGVWVSQATYPCP